MTVSVVIPTYNHREFVLAAIESVFAQGFGDVEIIVVNDGATDGTRDVLAPLIAGGRIRYVEQENGGQALARNRGIAESRGEFVALLDDDDLWPPGKLEWQVRVLLEDPAAVMVYGDCAYLRAGELTPETDRAPRPCGAAYEAFRLRNWIMSPGQTLIRRAALDRVGAFDVSIWGSDDWELYIRLAEIGTFAYRPRVALHYRVHELNASRRAALHARNHLKVVRRHLGWNVPLVLAHQRQAARYFVPRLLDLAASSRAAGQHGEAVRAYLYSLAFRPSLLARPWYLAALGGALLRRPPRRCAAAPTASPTVPPPTAEPQPAD